MRFFAPLNYEGQINQLDRFLPSLARELYFCGESLSLVGLRLFLDFFC